MLMRIYRTMWSYTLDRSHGFGILFDFDGKNEYQKCFYEDGTLTSGQGLPDAHYFINDLEKQIPERWTYGWGRKKQELLDRMTETGSCDYILEDEDRIIADLKVGMEKCQVRIEKKSSSFYYDYTCSCGKSDCIHPRAAAVLLKPRLASLQHVYVMTDLPVDKGLFLEQDLMNRTENLPKKEIGLSKIEEIRQIIQMVSAANSDIYYRLYHRYILDLSPDYDYDSKFLEKYYADLLIALFEDGGYQKAVLDAGGYADPEGYETQQHRSNRVCLKRVLKEYQKIVKGLSKIQFFLNDPYTEYLLQYRSAWQELLAYYAAAKSEIEESDLAFLDRIAEEEPELHPIAVGKVAEKLDRMEYAEERTGPVLQRLTEKIPREEKVKIYSGLKRLSMPTDEIRELGKEEQQKMVWNTPITGESFQYIMDELLADQEPAVRGKFILHAAEEIRYTKDASLKKAVAGQAAKLPDNRLLLRYIQNKLRIENRAEPREGDPEREISSFFRCEYEIERDRQQMYVDFCIRDPETGSILLHARDIQNRLLLMDTFYSDLGYTASQIRKVCLKGREKEYAEEMEVNRDALAADLFEEKNRKFSREYRQFCEELTEEKILYTEGVRAGIEWMIYREGGSNALAFRVGHSRMYIVKDAMEFLAAFRKGATAEYGKDLILTHDSENLNEADAAIIKLLMTAKYTKGRKSDPGNKRYITINNALLERILEALSGRTVLYNDNPCLIRLENRKIRLKINEKYTLSTDVNEKNQELLNLQGKGYLLTRREGDSAVMDRVQGSAEEINLISLVQENPSVCIRPILKDFRKNVYARFFEMFDVDKSVEKDFTLSQLRLNTYFDLERNAITARTVLLKDETEIRPEQLTERIDRAKVELLDAYLRSLGFEENRLTEESRVLAFFKMDFTRLKTLTNVYLSENLRNKELKSVGRPVIRVTYQNNLVRVFLEKSDFSEAELEQIIAGLRKKRKYILLDGERIVDLDSDAARDFGEAVNDFGMDPKDLYRKKTISMINAIKAFSHEKSCRVDQYLRDMIEEIRSFKEAEIPAPELKSPLRDYQAEGFRWMSILCKYGMGGILADDMGLGKTIQVIALIRADRGRKPILIVCPKSLVFNWISEFARFDGMTRVTAIYGPDSRRSEIISGINGREKRVYITSYDSLRNDISKYECDFSYVILDEAQYIKNVNAQKTKSVKELKATHRFALTGTPIENSVVDLWSIFDFIMPGYFEELSRFRETDPAMIARKAGPFILRRVKEDVLEDLPPKYERILSADMSEEQRRIYDAMRMEARKALEEGGRAFDLLPYLTRLRQVCVDPGMFVENYQGGSGKMSMLSTLIPEYLEAHHRILIFSQFVKALESVQTMLRAQGIDTFFLSGATPAKERVEMMDSFNNGSGTDVFLISLKAGGTGLNLTGADTVIHLDPWWNVAAENQASDRTHRIGQTRNVEVIKLIAGESIEQRVVELQDMKKEVIRQVISDDDGSVTSASLEDIAFVLE